eukprot:SAG31_NODE_2159_length_6302_cov_9.311140_5_plen_56_part_00
MLKYLIVEGIVVQIGSRLVTIISTKFNRKYHVFEEVPFANMIFILCDPLINAVDQ